MATTAWRAAHATCTACAHASLLVANALLYTSYADMCDTAETARLRVEHRLGLPFTYAARAATASLSAAWLTFTFAQDLLTVAGMLTLLAAHGTGTLAIAAARHLSLCARCSASRCTTELTPAWLMSTLALRYLPLIALRLLWNRADLVSHVDALPHRGRCHCFLRDLFHYGRRWSLLFVATDKARSSCGSRLAPRPPR